MTDSVGVMERALGILDRPEKWHKGGWHNRDKTALCLSAACVVASNRLLGIADPPTEVLDLLEKAIRREGFESRGRYVALFNDHPETTFEDVQRVLVLARELAEQAGNGGSA